MQKKWLVLILSLAALVTITCAGALYYWLAIYQKRVPPAPPAVMSPVNEAISEYNSQQPLTITFNEAMDAASTEAALQVEPLVNFTAKWQDERTLLLSFSGMQPEQTYSVSIGEGAKSRKGLTISKPFSISLHMPGLLAVSSVQPAALAQEVPLDSSITVVFNRPVVALSAKLDQQTLPQPLTFDPPVSGKGEWLNTAIYRFTPSEPFSPSTEYEAVVSADLKDISGIGMTEAFHWRFSTVAPQVLSFAPEEKATDSIGAMPAKTTDPVKIVFGQPMDQASVQAGLIVRLGDGQKVSGKIRWAGDALIFTPASPWPRGANVTVSLSGAKASGGAVLGPLTWSFNVIEELRLVSSEPANNSSGISPGASVVLYFSAPVDEKTLQKNMRIEPDPGEFYIYLADDLRTAYVNFSIKAATTYKVTIGADTTDISGWRLGKTETLTFSSGNYNPSLSLINSWYPWAFGDQEEAKGFIRYRNISALNLALYRLPEQDFLRLMGDDWNFRQSYQPGKGNVVRSWQIQPKAKLNEWGLLATPLAEAGGPLPPGIYYLTCNAPELAKNENVYNLRQIIVVSKYSLALKYGAGSGLVWATGWHDGQPKSGLPVRILDASGGELAKGQTDADGIFTGQVTRQESWLNYFVIAGDSESGEFGVAASQWNNGINPWKYDISTGGSSSPYSVYLYTDRSIYRPDQTVYFKGIVRMDDDARYSLPKDMPLLELTCQDAMGQEIMRQELKVNDMGTFSGSFVLAKDAPLGYYSLYLPLNDSSFGASFQVAEYKRPEYEVQVETNKEEYIQGDNIAVTAQASYYFGGPVADAAVRWTVMTQDYFFDWQGEGYYDFGDYNYLQERHYYGPYGESIGEGEGQTDSQGRFTFNIPADIAKATLSQSYTIEVTVTDLNNQEVSSRTTVMVHKGEFYIGLRPQSYVSAAGKEAALDVITVDSKSQPVGKQALDVTFFEHRWYNVREKMGDGYQWKTTEEDVQVDSQKITTNAQGKAVVSFLPKTPGTYKALAIGKDQAGNEIRTSTYIWVTGSGYVSWAMQEDYTIKLITDKKEYRVGETAKVLVPNPYTGEVRALLTMERGGVIEHRVITVNSSSQLLEIPITEDYAPNIFFVVLLVRGADEDAALPPFQVGYAGVAVSTEALQLQLALTPDKTGNYAPGDKATLSLLAKDSKGNPVQAEVSLNMVDKSVLALAQQEQQNILDYFYGQRSLGVQTALTLSLSTESISALIPGDGKGGGGGPGGGAVRERFPETAYWQAQLRTDANGRASVTVDLPDNLTTWSVEAKAVTADTLVAQKTIEIVATKNLLLRPTLPRFMVVGDKARVGAVVHNNTPQKLDVVVQCQAEGLEGDFPAQTVSLEPGGKASVTWEVSAKAAGRGSITLNAKAGNYEDAVRQSLPIYAMTTVEVVATSGQVAPGETQVEAVSVPERYDGGELTVNVEASLAGGMIPGLEYLKHYPYECTEQVLSRFLPNIITARALQDLGISDEQLSQGLDEQVPVGLQRLYNTQHDDGGWGWWYKDRSYPYMSAYVIFGLAQAKKANYPVDDAVFDRGVSYLADVLNRSNSNGKEKISDDVRAYIAYVLAEAGEGDLGASVKLLEDSKGLSTRGKAYLLMALQILSPNEKARLDGLVAELKGSVLSTSTTNHWQDPPDLLTMGSNVVTTAVVTQALVRVAPDSELLPGAVRWLMGARQEGHWRSTYETATSIMALTEYMAASGELKADYNWNIALNGRKELSGSYDSSNLTERQTLTVEIAKLLRDRVNSISLTRLPKDGNAQGWLYYDLSLRYYPPAEEILPVNAGVIVAREYTAVDDPNKRVDGAAVNDMIRVKLTIIAPTDLYHLVVEDPFPAGCEGVDTSLRTTTAAGVQPEVIAKDDPWGWWWFSQSEIRDDKAVLFATYLPQGTYEYVYYIRASVPGEYNVRPVNAYQMYFPDVFGHSEGRKFVVQGESQ